MDRRLIAGLLSLWLGGCAVSRSAMPRGTPATQPVEMGEVDTLPPLGDAMARTYAERDAATRQVGQVVESPAVDDPPPPGRRAPFADRTSGSPRPQAAATNGAEPSPRPAPFADRAPSGPRPQAPSATPATAPVQAPPSAPEQAAPAPAPAPAPEPMPGAPPSPFTGSQAPRANNAPIDSQLQPTSAVLPAPTASRPPAKAGAVKAALVNAKAAMVGTEIITVRQVWAAMIDKRERYAKQWSQANPAEKQAIFNGTLNSLIDRALLVQAAKKKIKDIKTFNDEVDKDWTEHELPPMLREHGVSNIHELKRKLTADGKSLDQMRDEYRLDVLARQFMIMQIKEKLRVSFPEMTAYYDANREQFRRSAQVVWREIDVEIAKCRDRAEARARAEDLLARVRRGDDFAGLARAASHGATAKEGGKWETAPGGSANADINAALAALAPGQASSLIEAPGSFHIVRVDSKREAGVAPFHEVQDRIKEELMMQKSRKAADTLLDSLRAKTVVTTIFDRPDVDPAAVKTGAKVTKPAGR